MIELEKNKYISMEYLKEYRCKYCNKLFFKGELSKATIEIKCRNCKNFNVIEGENCKLFLVADQKGKYNPGKNKMKAVIKCDHQHSDSDHCNTCDPHQNHS